MPKKWGTCKECGRAAKHKDKCSQGIGGAPKQISQETARELLRVLEYVEENAGEDSPDMWGMVSLIIKKAKKELSNG